MLVERKEYKEDGTDLTYLESVFKSENILSTTYFPHSHRLYIVFSRGDMYRYENIPPEFYQDFEDADSHGKFFHKHIKNRDSTHYRREYKLLPYEIEGLKKIVESHKPEENEDE